MSISLLSRLSIACALLISGVVAASGAARFTEVRTGLYTGGQPDVAQLRQFAHDRFTTVIDLRGEDESRGYDEAAVTGELGLDYVRLPIRGASDLTAANAAALTAALKAARGPVLLHCASGNRVGALLALSAANGDGLTSLAALELGQRAGLKSLEAVVRERLGLAVK